MTSKLSHLTILQPNKTVVFYSPVEGKDVLVRTGTVSDSSIFHSVLHAYSKDYITMGETGRSKFVKRLKNSIMRKVDKNHWENLSNGLIAKIPFQENFEKILDDFYKFILYEKTGKTKSVRNVIRKVADEDLDAYKLIAEMIPFEKFKKYIIPSAYEKCEDQSKSVKTEVKVEKSVLTDVKIALRDCSVAYYKKEFEKLGDESKGINIEFYIDKLKKMIQTVSSESEDFAYSEYIESLNENDIDVDQYTIGLMSDKFNRDIYFIDSKTRLPYKMSEDIQKRKTIVLMWAGGSRYEVVGKLLPGNRVQREFDHSDPFIKRIHTFLYNPEKLVESYPNLVSFLPKNTRIKLGIDIADDEIENEIVKSRSRSPSYKKEMKNKKQLESSPKKQLESSDNNSGYESSSYEKSDSDNE